MVFSLDNDLAVLERTPGVLTRMLSGMPEDMVTESVAGEDWRVIDVVGHLLHGEKVDWPVRVKAILSGEQKAFEPFDRFAMLDWPASDIASQLEEFATMRVVNLEGIKNIGLTVGDLGKTGVHPEFGEVTLGQLLSTWVVHDLGHIAQITRIMAKRLRSDVGPWSNYLGILNL